MTPDLACVVMSYRDEPFLAEAVQSVLAQDVPVEIVVVNSGGGDPGGRLAQAGITVPVHSVDRRLFPGAVRNIGIERTRARYVAFLAADCVASPGWATARLREHAAGAAGVGAVMANACPDSATAWAGMLLLHVRRLPATPEPDRLVYGLSYDRALFERYGTFREDLRAGEDTEFNGRIRGEARIVLALDVVTAHRYETGVRRMLRDSVRRGGLQAAMHGAIEGRSPRRLRVAVRGMVGVARAALVALRSARPDRGHLLRALPLMVAGSAAYALGALMSDGSAPGD